MSSYSRMQPLFYIVIYLKYHTHRASNTKYIATLREAEVYDIAPSLELIAELEILTETAERLRGSREEQVGSQLLQIVQNYLNRAASNPQVLLSQDTYQHACIEHRYILGTPGERPPIDWALARCISMDPPLALDPSD